MSEWIIREVHVHLKRIEGRFLALLLMEGIGELRQAPLTPPIFPTASKETDLTKIKILPFCRALAFDQVLCKDSLWLRETIVKKVLVRLVESSRINLQLIPLGVVFVGPRNLVRKNRIFDLLRNPPVSDKGLLDFGGLDAVVEGKSLLLWCLNQGVVFGVLLTAVVVVERNELLNDSGNSNFLEFRQVLLNVFFADEKEVLDEVPDLHLRILRRLRGVPFRLHFHCNFPVQELG